MAKSTLLPRTWAIAWVALFFLPMAFGAEKIATTPKWQRFELTLKSSVAYTNPLQEAEMRVLFVSPRGETNRVYGFWDGGKTWRVRFQPNFPGRWTYYTMCSDTANPGLHEQTGTLLCTASIEASRFDRHGTVHVARSQQHLEHADRTPFLWLGDAAWAAAIKSSTADWLEYVQTRAKQKFNVIQWRLNFGDDKQAAFQGREEIRLNLEVLRQLDAKIATANRAGLLCAIAPLWEIGLPMAEQLPDEQAIRLLRYIMARWGADQVAWIIAFESDSSGEAAARWQKIGRAVFNQVTHAPVILFPGESIWVLDGYRGEKWVDALGVQSANAVDESLLPWLLQGPLRQEREKQPIRPLITLSPPAERQHQSGRGQIDADFCRQLLWWSLLLNTPAGVSYSAPDIQDWTSEAGKKTPQPWQQALNLPGAGFIAPMADFLPTQEYWKLSPLATSEFHQTDLSSPQQRIVAASSPEDRTSLFYAPQECTFQIFNQSRTSSTRAIWFNPRTAERLTAMPRHLASGVAYTTPGPGDWVLQLSRISASGRLAEAKKPQPMIDKSRRD